MDGDEYLVPAPAVSRVAATSFLRTWGVSVLLAVGFLAYGAVMVGHGTDDGWVIVAVPAIFLACLGGYAVRATVTTRGIASRALPATPTAAVAVAARDTAEQPAAPRIRLGGGDIIEVDGTKSPDGVPWVIMGWQGGATMNVARPSDIKGVPSLRKDMQFGDLLVRNPKVLLDQLVRHGGTQYTITQFDDAARTVELTAGDGTVQRAPTVDVVSDNLQDLFDRLEFTRGS